MRMRTFESGAIGMLGPIVLAALLISAPDGADAEEVPFSPDATTECLDAGGGADCIGRSASDCIASPGGDTTVGMGFCLGAELDFWDDRLNATYQSLMALEVDYDAELDEWGASAPRTAPALRDMQRAWIAFRDAACAYERAQWGGGTGQGPATADCLMRETARQSLRLEARLPDMEGQ